MQIVSAHTAPKAAATGAPRFTGGISYVGDGKFSAFAAKSSGVAGDATGYASLDSALRALTMLTVGANAPAAGIFERNGRFYGRSFSVAETFSSGATWTGPWRLEQHPDDRVLLDAKTTTRADALRMVVDGAQRIDVTALPVAAPKTRS